MPSLPHAVRLVFCGLAAGLLISFAGAPAARAAADPDDPTPPIVELGNDTYAITRGATFFYFRNTAKLVTRARTDAQKFCRDMGKEMKELKVEEIKAGLVIGNFAKARITFQAVAPGTLPPPESRAPGAAAPAAPALNDGGDLTKLEELHRGGVLSDAEFAAAKKRLAERSLEELHRKGVLSDPEFEAARKRLNER